MGRNHCSEPAYGPTCGVSGGLRLLKWPRKSPQILRRAKYQDRDVPLGR